MTILENDLLRVSIDTKGAQITSLINKSTGVEQMWQADPEVWPWHAPNLFPIVGGLINDELLIDGKTYPMKRHGFARLSEFVLLKSDDEQAVFSLPNSEKIKAIALLLNKKFAVVFLLILSPPQSPAPYPPIDKKRGDLCLRNRMMSLYYQIVSLVPSPFHC